MKLIRNERGQSLVEFAIILPIIMLVLMGILQFGIILNSYLTVQNAVREGVRVGITGSSDADIRAAISSTSPTLDMNNLTIIITPALSDRKSGSTMTVKINYKYNMIVPIISSLFKNGVQLNAQTSMRIE